MGKEIIIPNFSVISILDEFPKRKSPITGKVYMAFYADRSDSTDNYCDEDKAKYGILLYMHMGHSWLSSWAIKIDGRTELIDIKNEKFKNLYWLKPIHNK